MLEKYFYTPLGNDKEEYRRALAVSAAIEIAKASVGAPSAYSGVKAGLDLNQVAAEISALADAIQDAMENNEDNQEE
jgi:hypothetical protein